MAVKTFHLANNDAGPQTLKSRATDIFQLQAYIYPKTGNTGGGTIALSIVCTDSRGINGATTVVAKSETVPATGSWSLLSGSAAVPVGYDTVDPVLTLTSVPLTDTIYIDDVLVREETLAQATINSLFTGGVVGSTVLPAAVPSLDASKITTGALAAARIGALPASQITSGTFLSSFLPMFGLSQSAGTNLVLDPGIESTTVWTHAGYTVSTAQAHSGTHSLSMVGTGASPVISLIQSDSSASVSVASRVGEIFQLGIWVFPQVGNVGGGNLLLRALFTDSTAHNAPTFAQTNVAVSTLTAGVWAYITGNFTVPTGYDTVTPEFFLNIVPTGDVFFLDDLLVREVTLAQSTISALFSGGTVGTSILQAAVPSLDASKITTGTFAQTFVSGLTSLWNSWFGTTTPTGASTLNAANVAPLDASKITTGTFAQSFVSGLQSLWTSWFGTATPTGASTLNAANVAALDASKVTTGIFGATQIPDLDVGTIQRTTTEDVVALLHCDDTNGSTTAADSSSVAANFTGANGAVINTAQAKFGTASMDTSAASTAYFAPTGPASEYAFGTNDFTIEMWVYAKATMNNNGVLGYRPGAVNGAYPVIWMLNGKLSYYVNSVFQITDTVVLTLNAWHHVAVSRTNGVTKLFRDGTLVGSWTDATNYLCSTGYPTIGNDYSRAFSFNGYIDELRITNGYSWYSATFTPPAAPLTTQTTHGLDSSVQSVDPKTGQYFGSVLSSLLSGLIGTGLIPGLDASKITTGTFAQSFVSGLQSLWTSWFGTATPTGASTLNAANVAPLDASKVTTGTFAQTFVSGLTSLWNSWFGTTTPTGASTLNAANVASLDASKIISGLFGSAQIPNITAGSGNGQSADLLTHLTNVAAVTGSMGSTPLTAALAALQTQANTLATLAAQVQQQQTSDIGAGQSGQSFLVAFNSYPTGSFTVAPFVTTYGNIPGAGSHGTGTLTIANGDASWNVVNNGDVSALGIYTPGYTLIFTGTPTAGTFTLTYINPTTGVSATTTAIAWNASAATIQTALRALTNMPTNGATVVSSQGTSFVIALAATGSLTCTSSVTGGTAVVTNYGFTNTDYQQLNAAIAGFPNGANSKNFAILRSNAAGTDYVYGVVFLNSSWQLCWELGCYVGGTQHVFASGTNAPLNLNFYMVAGVGAEPYRFQGFSGNSQVFDYTDSAHVSQLGSTHRYWGFRSDTATNGTIYPAPAAYVGCADNLPPTIPGSGIRLYRTGTAGVAATFSMGAHLFSPFNFFDAISENSPDITQLTSFIGSAQGTATPIIAVANAGRYIVSMRVMVATATCSAGAVTICPAVGRYNSVGTLQETRLFGASAMFANAVGAQLDANWFGGTEVIGCQAGDYLQAGYFLAAGPGGGGTMTALSFTGEATGQQTYFEVTLANWSFN